MLPRRGLERHQGDLGPRLGQAARPGRRGRAGRPDEQHPRRQLPDLPRRGRRASCAQNFFGRDPRVAKMVEDIPDDELWALKRGGMDYRKLYSAYKTAVEHTGQPTVILAKTIKGWSLGSALREPQRDPPDEEALARGPADVPRPARHPDPRRQARQVPAALLQPGPDDPRIKYMHGAASDARRLHAAAADGAPSRCRSPPTRPTRSSPAGSGKQEVATTMAFVRLFKDLIRDPDIGYRFVPIIPDEARTFGMDALFPTLKIYNPNGQNYLSVDRELMLSYKEATNGQILHEGIDEAGSVASFTAVGSSYSTHDQPMIPVYIFYSMFGFQRTADSLWAGRRPDGPRLRDGRHRRTHDAQRRGPAARGRPQPRHRDDQPGGRRLRPGVRLRDRAHRARRPAPDVRRGLRERLLLPHDLQRALSPAAAARGPRRRGPAARHVPASRRPPPITRSRRRSWPPASGCPGRSRPRACWPRTGASPPTSGRSRPGPSCARTGWRRTAQPARPDRRGRGPLRHDPPPGPAGPGRRRLGLHAAPCRT